MSDLTIPDSETGPDLTVGDEAAWPGIIEVDFEGPYTWFGGDTPSILDCPYERGLYVWAFNSPEGAKPYAVGLTNSPFAVAHIDPLRQYLAGRNPVLDMESYSYGERKVVWRGYANGGQNPERDGFIDDPLRLGQAFAMLRVMGIFVAPVWQEERSLVRVYTGLAKALVRHTPLILGPLAPKRLEERPLTAAFTPPGRFPGLPEYLVV